MGEIKISELTAKGSDVEATDLLVISESDGAGGYVSKYVTGSELGGGSSANTIYTADDTILGARQVSIGTSLDFTGGKLDRTNVNGRNIVEVVRATDLPGTLVANTTYVIRGQITFTSVVIVNVEGCEIIGLDRNEDELIWSGTGSFIRVVDVNFGISNVKFSSTQENTIIRAVNYTAGNYNDGRNKVLRISDVQFRGAYSVMEVTGFDLVDINNCLFFYIKATILGLQFTDVSKLQITSCELIRWFDESTLPTPSGFASVSMINLLGSMGAVNINGCIIHPQDVQNGIEIDSASTTGFGTISSNAFIDINLNGDVFLPVNQIGLPNYSTTATNDFDVYANQGVLNSTSGVLMTLVNNTTVTALTQGVPIAINTGGGALQQSAVRYTTSGNGLNRYDGSKQVYASIHATISYEKQGSGTDNYIFYLYKNGSLLPGSAVSVRVNQDDAITLIYGTLMNSQDTIEIYVENPSSSDQITITDLQLIIRE